MRCRNRRAQSTANCGHVLFRAFPAADWLAWFLATLHRAIDQAQVTLDAVLSKARFWQRFAGVPMNARQIRVLNRLLDGFEGKLTTGKWAAVAKCSSDTALRDIGELLSRGYCKVDTRGPQHELRACRTLSRTPGLRLQRDIKRSSGCPSSTVSITQTRRKTRFINLRSMNRTKPGDSAGRQDLPPGETRRVTAGKDEATRMTGQVGAAPSSGATSNRAQARRLTGVCPCPCTWDCSPGPVAGRSPADGL